MKNKHYFPQVSLLICILCCFPHLIHAYSLRQFSNKNGLSNSAILSLYQDHQGVIWIGSCDGLNIFDGTNIHVYNPVNPTKAPLSGNLINDIMETEKDVLWIQTNYGLDRLDTKLQTSKSFTEFKDKNYMAKSRDNDLFICKRRRIYLLLSTGKTTLPKVGSTSNSIRTRIIHYHRQKQYSMGIHFE